MFPSFKPQYNSFFNPLYGPLIILENMQIVDI